MSSATNREIDSDSSSVSYDDEDFSENESEYEPDENLSNSSDSETSADEQNDGNIIDPLFISKDQTVWSPMPVQPEGGRANDANIITLRPGH